MIVWYASGPTEIANLQTPLFELTLDDFISEHCDPHQLEADRLALAAQTNATIPTAKRCVHISFR
jgi:hypothetical protein